MIPALNAARFLPATLAALGSGADEVVVVDGGSGDATRDIAADAGAMVCAAPRGRGIQLSQGIAAATGNWLLLLHADTCLQAGWEPAARAFMAEPALRAAYFRLALNNRDPRARRLERLVAWRSRTLGLPYGDQGLLLPRRLLAAVGGIRPLPLMEDVELARRIGRVRLAALDIAAVTSAERWERDGWLARSARNLACLSLYFAGVPPRWLALLYG